jgi:hypothetical protein
MTVKELIKKLQGFDPNTMVVIDSVLEAGINDATTVRLIDIALNVNSDPYCAPHEEARLLLNPERYNIVKALIIY